MTTQDTLETEIELLAASLLPEERLTSEPAESWPREISITNATSQRTLHVRVGEKYPARDAVSVELSGNDIGRDEASAWGERIAGHLDLWDPEEEYPLFTALTAIVPYLVPDPAPPETTTTKTAQETPVQSIPHHALLTSHHLLSPTKRKNFQHLASRLSLTGFSKVGHPGIYYAIGEEADLEEWLREVKSWNWLALRVRVGIEPVPGGEAGELDGKGKDDGARGGKGRGDWVELEKISEALEWMRERGRERMLVDIGIGGGGG